MELKITKREEELYVEQKLKAKFSSPREEFEKYSSIYTKECSKCGVVKRLAEFAGNTSGADGFDRDGYRLRRPECKECTKAANQGKDEAKKLAKDSGIPYKAPEGTRCALCGMESKKGDGLVFDHCHTKKIFRGYLHNSCNRSLGVLGDDIAGMVRCINYLMKSEPGVITQDPETGELSFAPAATPAPAAAPAPAPSASAAAE